MSDPDDYIVKHYVRVSDTSAALKWVPCGPDCTHERQPDVPGGELTSVVVTPWDPRLEHALPCPFCGSRNLEMGRMANHVHCAACDADGPLVRPRYREETWRMAVERWNWRR